MMMHLIIDPKRNHMQTADIDVKTKDANRGYGFGFHGGQVFNMFYNCQLHKTFHEIYIRMALPG